jgi:hypothetical protein
MLKRRVRMTGTSTAINARAADAVKQYRIITILIRNLQKQLKILPNITTKPVA